MGPTWQKRPDLDPQLASDVTHREVPGQSQGTVKRPRSGQWPQSWKSPPLPKNSQNNAPTHQHVKLPSLQILTTPNFRAALAFWDGPQSVCGMCFSLYLNKSTSYLLPGLSLNSFCDETSRT